MKRTIILISILPLLASCTAASGAYDRVRFGENPYSEPPFYTRYLSPDAPLDRQIWDTLEGLRSNPDSPSLHNELGSLLLAKGFPADAEREFVRAVRADSRLYPAWYNLGLVRQARGNDRAATRAFRRTVDLRPGHPAAHFQLGLIYEEQGRVQAAIDHYARSLAINPGMLDVRINPRIVDTQLIDRALLRNYEAQRKAGSARFQAVPSGYLSPAERREQERREQEPEAPSPQPDAEEIVTPAPSIPEQVQATPPAVD